MTEKQEEEVRRGKRAEIWLADETVQAAFLLMQADIISGWRSAMTQEDRERYWVLDQHLDEFKRKLSLFVSNGRVAESSLT